MNLANEGLEARKKEEEVNARKRKAEEEARWEGASSSLLFANVRVLMLITCIRRESRAEGRQLAELLQRLKEEEKDEGRRSGLTVELRPPPCVLCIYVV